jgi:hypothetical protein
VRGGVPGGPNPACWGEHLWLQSPRGSRRWCRTVLGQRASCRWLAIGAGNPAPQSSLLGCRFCALWRWCTGHWCRFCPCGEPQIATHHFPLAPAPSREHWSQFNLCPWHG